MTTTPTPAPTPAPTRRVVVINGAGGALGSAISRQMASEPNTDLVLSDLSQASLDGSGMVGEAGQAIATVPRKTASTGMGG